MFSKACEYAIRALIYVIKKTEDGSRAAIRDIAFNTGTPEPYVAKVLQTLSRRGFVASIKGPNGGFFFDPKSKDLPLIDIVKAIDGDTFFTGCGLGIKYCTERRPCPIHFEYKEIRERITKMLKENTVQDLASGLVAGKTFLMKK
ncbi:MAG TPA: Rrf2 family transcriptional regulator [Chryseosolibacter sp.]|nr:Rrf2 family transcriptional regulator [Chryseosolibacter sp.]